MTASKPVVRPILMPQAGNTMEEGTILSWRVREGDMLNVGDVILEVETDKAVVEVEAVESGRLVRIVVQEAETIEVLRPVAYLADSDADLEAYLASQKEQEPSAAPETAAVADESSQAKVVVVPESSAAAAEGGRMKASPAARKLAAERGVELHSVRVGSGPGGRILSADLPEAAAAASSPAQSAAALPPGATRRPMSSVKRAAAKALKISKQTIPHFYVERTIDAGALLKFYRQEKEKYRCTINSVIVHACGRAVGEFAAFRSRLEGQDLVEFPSSNIGVAVQTEGGLMVPVVKGVESRTIRETATEMRRVVEAARAGKLFGLGEAVFTVSNMGMLGVERFSAIINPPEAAILAVGALRETAVVSDGVMRPGRCMTLTLSCDHRLIDGVMAAKFLNRLKELLEAPEALA